MKRPEQGKTADEYEVNRRESDDKRTRAYILYNNDRQYSMGDREDGGELGLVYVQAASVDIEEEGTRVPGSYTCHLMLIGSLHL